MADHGHPAFVRHHQVEKEDVVRWPLQRGDGLAAGEEDVDAESLVAEDARDEPLHRRIVVQQKNALAALEEGHQAFGAATGADAPMRTMGATKACGAGCRIRTSDPLRVKQTLYR